MYQCVNHCIVDHVVDQQNAITMFSGNQTVIKLVAIMIRYRIIRYYNIPWHSYVTYNSKV